MEAKEEAPYYVAQHIPSKPKLGRGLKAGSLYRDNVNWRYFDPLFALGDYDDAADRIVLSVILPLELFDNADAIIAHIDHEYRYAIKASVVKVGREWVRDFIPDLYNRYLKDLAKSLEPTPFADYKPGRPKQEDVDRVADMMQAAYVKLFRLDGESGFAP